MVSSEGCEHGISSDELRKGQNKKSENPVSEQAPNIGKLTSESNGETPPISIPENKMQKSVDTISSSQLDQEGGSYFVLPYKSLQNPKTGSCSLQSGPNETSPCVVREKVSHDGYNWRKYGQKYVKGNQYIRSYYKCTHAHCQAKKHFEQSIHGKQTDTIYFGQHDHPRSQDMPPAIGVSVAVVEERLDEPSPTDKEVSSSGVKDVQSQSCKLRDQIRNIEDPESKRQKKDICIAGVIPVDKLTGEARAIIQTLSEVDNVNDGYRWRKYGQKLVKGNPNPRSYYRCTNTGCPVKKHIERAAHDPKIVITTYEGQHDHDIPPARTVAHNAVAKVYSAVACMKSRSEAEAKTVTLEMGEINTLDTYNKSDEKLNGEASCTSFAGDVIGYDLVGDPESKTSEPEKENDESEPRRTEFGAPEVMIHCSLDINYG